MKPRVLRWWSFTLSLRDTAATDWLVRLPGDSRIEGGHSTFYFPIVTCILPSVILSLLFALFRR